MSRLQAYTGDYSTDSSEHRVNIGEEFDPELEASLLDPIDYAHEIDQLQLWQEENQ